MDCFLNRSLHTLISKMEPQKDVIILKGSGKIFCAGGDIKQMINNSSDHAHFVYSLGCRSYDLIANYRKPYVVIMDGLTMGGAAFYTMPGKYRIATERTVFSMPETIIGYFNDAGSSYFLSRLDNNFGIYMGLTGAQVKGFDTKTVGLATHFIESKKLDELEKNLIQCKTNEEVETVLDYSSEPPSRHTGLEAILPNINKCFGSNTVEKIYKNLQQDDSDWANKTLNALKANSPTAIKVSFRSITSGKNMSLRNCLKMEMGLTINHNTDSMEVKEGVRAVLIDKDFKPNWSRKSIYDVTDENVERYFKPIEQKYELNFEENIQNKL